MRRAERERGSVVVFSTAIVVMAVLFALAVARLAGAAADKARANTAADAAALAAAQEVASGHGAREALATASRIASENDARVVGFATTRDAVVVSVAVHDARSRARADVDRLAQSGQKGL